MSDNVRFSIAQEKAMQVWWDCNGRFTEIARQIGVSERTVRRWSSSPAFMERLNALRQTATEKAKKRLTDNADNAAKTLTNAANSGDVSAAVHVLKALNIYKPDSANMNKFATFFAGYNQQLQMLLNEHCDDETADLIAINLNDWLDANTEE
ncbi:MAG: hypothetical protein ABFD83_05605 [Armatimonadota bacterium]